MGTGYVVNGYEVRNPHTLAVYFRWQDTRRDVVEVVEMPLGDGGAESETEIVKECEMPAGTRVVLSKEQEEMMVARYVADEGWQLICRDYGIGKPRFRKILEEHGVRWRGRGGSPHPSPLPEGEGDASKRRVPLGDRNMPPTPPVMQEPGRMILETQELDVRHTPISDRRPREYVPPAIIRTGQLRAVEPVSLLQPELVGDGRDVLVQLGRLNNLIRELRSIEGVVVQGSVSIALNVEAQI